MKTTRTAMFLVASVALIGCVESDPVTTQDRVRATPVLPTSVPTVQRNDAISLVGTYSVPVPIALLPYASYDVAISVTPAKQPGDTFSISFPLPEGLFGFSEEATFTGTADSITGEVEVTGRWGAGTCRQGEIPSCDLAYYDFSLDETAVFDFWMTRDSASAINRVKVSQLFDADPLGVLAASAPTRVTL